MRSAHPDIELDPFIAHAGLIYDERERAVFTTLYREYLGINAGA